MTPALDLTTIGHWSQTEKVTVEHIRGEHTNVIEYCSEAELTKKIVEIFSFEGNTLVNMAGDITSGETPSYT